MDAIRNLFGHYRFAAIALVTLLTLGIVGAVVLTTTSVGCGAANKLGLRTAHCLEGGKVGNVAGVIPSPSPLAKGGYVPPTEQPSPPPPPAPPVNPGASAIPPYNPNASSEPPPYQNPASSGMPLAYPASGSPPSEAFTCRLPVYAGGPGSGGFIVFPTQTFVADPRSAVTVPSPSPGGPSPTPPPAYGPGGPQGWYGETYDARYTKWLPVQYAWVSPDGTHYAYPLGGDIYAQNVANGSQLELGPGHGFYPIDTENDGVYVTTPNQPGLWFLPFAGSPKQITSAGFWQGYANGAAYGTPTSQVPPGATNTIERLDVSTGAVVDFFSQAGAQSFVMGFDAQGNPVIQSSYTNGNAIFIVTAPNTGTAIASVLYGGYGYQQPPPYPSGTPIADSHGLWFTVGNGVVMYRNGAWYWMASIGGQLAGQCL